MANDVPWSEVVRRWCDVGHRRSIEPSDPPGAAEPDDALTLGYEAAQPALQACHWPDAPARDVNDPQR